MSEATEPRTWDKRIIVKVLNGQITVQMDVKPDFMEFTPVDINRIMRHLKLEYKQRARLARVKSAAQTVTTIATNEAKRVAELPKTTIK